LLHEYLSVSPASEINAVKGVISKAFKKISLSQPGDKNGDPVKVENWRLRFKVATFQRKIILKIIK
jgi:hypothetical protein